METRNKKLPVHADRKCRDTWRQEIKRYIKAGNVWRQEM
jgi:hypothetical protein